MSVKMRLCFLKELLYIGEIIECATISKAASKNGIKASNLSKLIKDTEKEFNQKLFIRTSTGMAPTKTALEVLKTASAVNEIIKESQTKFLTLKSPENIKIFISQGLNVSGLSEVCPNCILCNDAKAADVIISTQRPENADKLITVEFRIGSNITQNIFICAKDLPGMEQVVTSLVMLFQN